MTIFSEPKFYSILAACFPGLGSCRNPEGPHILPREPQLTIPGRNVVNAVCAYLLLDMFMRCEGQCHVQQTQVDRRPSTVREVARLAGVSVATVSRVINGASNVTFSTKASVMTAISELDYAPNESAAELARSRGGVPKARGLPVSAWPVHKRIGSFGKTTVKGDENH